MDENIPSEDGQWLWTENNWLPVEDTDSETYTNKSRQVNTTRSVNSLSFLQEVVLFFFNIY